MKVFISWSGEQSKAVAGALRDWLPNVIQSVEPWVSSDDIRKGSRWGDEVGAKLETCKVGVVCITPDNVGEPWVNFEAGALGKSMVSGFVTAYLLGMKATEVEGPLSQFQNTEATKEDTLKLVESMNDVTDKPLPKERVKKAFETFWEELWERLEKARKMKPVVKTARRMEDVVNEILEIVRLNSQELGRVRGLIGAMEEWRGPGASRAVADFRDIVASERAKRFREALLSGSPEDVREWLGLVERTRMARDVLEQMKEEEKKKEQEETEDEGKE